MKKKTIAGGGFFLLVIGCFITYPALSLGVIIFFLAIIIFAKKSGEKPKEKLFRENSQNLPSNEFINSDISNLNKLSVVRMEEQNYQRIFEESTNIMDKTKNLHVFIERFLLICNTVDNAASYWDLDYTEFKNATVRDFPFALQFLHRQNN